MYQLNVCEPPLDALLCENGKRRMRAMITISIARAIDFSIVKASGQTDRTALDAVNIEPFVGYGRIPTRIFGPSCCAFTW